VPTAEPARASHRSHDPLLSTLILGEGPLAGLVRSYPGLAGLEVEPAWLDSWFCAQIPLALAAGEAGMLAGALDEDALAALRQPSARNVSALQLVSLEAQHFRGFRASGAPVDLRGKLVVIEGANSTGKTSLAEAIEWLFTGALQRRLMRQQGNPRELESCIQNQLRPDGADTWVTATFVGAKDEQLTLKRSLIADYGTASTSSAQSKLELNGKELSPAEERAALDAHFGGVPPILMQHTLREFINSTPAERRQYFERLLSLDEVTGLIERAVVGDPRLGDFAAPDGGTALAKWARVRELYHKESHQKGSAEAGLKLAEAELPTGRGLRVTEAMMSIARCKHADAIGGATELDAALRAMEKVQEVIREGKLPILARLRPKRSFDAAAATAMSSPPIIDGTGRWLKAREAALTAAKASASVSAAEREVSGAVEALTVAGVINAAAESQTCPVCLAEGSLSQGRLAALRGIGPLNRALSDARHCEATRRTELKQQADSAVALLADLAPIAPADADWEKATAAATPDLKGALAAARAEITQVSGLLLPLRQSLTTLSTQLAAEVPEHQSAEVARLRDDVASRTGGLSGLIARFDRAVKALDAAVGAEVSHGAPYVARDAWLGVARAVADVVVSLDWEWAKRIIQAHLGQLRDVLIEVRRQVLESRRTAFSTSMSSIWNALRGDRYSSFAELFIPPPRGKGFPVEIQVKAKLDDGTRVVEVDALRVFSESQVNALGIAAFVTRSRLLGHSVLVFDDPVQSMDEDHFRSFAGQLLPQLLDQGLQVVVLTHNDTFGRDISFAHSDRADYVTLSIRHSRRTGTQVEEGNRRVQERLAKAEHLGEEGKLQEAWKTVRLAIERLYVLALAKYSKAGFDPKSCESQAAEAMWEAGAGAMVTAKVAGSAVRLKDILDCTVAGAHDKSPRGFTDLIAATAYVKSLLGPLRIGG